MFIPGPNTDQSRTIGVGDNLLGFVDVHDDLGAGGNGGSKRCDRRGCAQRGFQLVPGGDPCVVATIENSKVVDASVVENHRRTCSGDLTCPASRPLLIGVAFGVTAVENDGGVFGDTQRPHRFVNGLRRTTIPIVPAFQSVGVEVKRPGQMTVLVLLGDAEIHVKEQKLSGRRRFRAFSTEQFAEPIGGYQLVVIGQTVGG